MAESTSSQGPLGAKKDDDDKTTTTTTASGSVSRQVIRPSSYDDELEPDALRGSDQVVKDSKVVDKEAERRERIFGKEDKDK
jgi:hypothetical protein